MILNLYRSGPEVDRLSIQVQPEVVTRAETNIMIPRSHSFADPCRSKQSVRKDSLPFDLPHVVEPGLQALGRHLAAQPVEGRQRGPGRGRHRLQGGAGRGGAHGDLRGRPGAAHHSATKLLRVAIMQRNLSNRLLRYGDTEDGRIAHRLSPRVQKVTESSLSHMQYTLDLLIHSQPSR